MALTVTAIPAQELTYRTKNKPSVVGRNAVELAKTLGSIRANTAGTVAGADASSATRGISFLQDRFKHTFWQFGSSVATTYLVFDTGSAGGSLNVDTFIVQDGHNWDTCTITVEADDTLPAVPWVGATTVFTFAVSGSGVIFKQHATNSYAARYWRVNITRGSAFIPQANQVWLGKTIQFPIKSDYDFAPIQAGGGEVIEVKTKGGVRYGYRTAGFLQGREQHFTINGLPDSTTPTTFFPDFEDCWKNSNAIYGGTRPFWYCEDPAAHPELAKFVYPTDPRYDVTVMGPNETRLILPTREQGSGT